MALLFLIILITYVSSGADLSHSISHTTQTPLGVDLEPIIEPFEHTIDSKKSYHDLGKNQNILFDVTRKGSKEG